MKPSEFERLYGGQSDFLMRCYVLEQRYPNASDGRIACLAYFQSTEANPSLAHWLEGYGVDFLHCDNLAGPLTVPGIRVVADRFTIVSREEGESAVVVPVCDEHLRPLDLFAFRPDNPGRWWTFLDQTAVLGAANVINPSSFAYGAMPIHLNPLQWFRAGCEGGGVVLHAGRGRQVLRQAVGPILAKNLSHARRLEHVLAPEITPDRIMSLGRHERRRAA